MPRKNCLNCLILLEGSASWTRICGENTCNICVALRRACLERGSCATHRNRVTHRVFWRISVDLWHEFAPQVRFLLTTDQKTVFFCLVKYNNTGNVFRWSEDQVAVAVEKKKSKSNLTNWWTIFIELDSFYPISRKDDKQGSFQGSD